MRLVLFLVYPEKNSQRNPVVPEARLRSEPPLAQIKPNQELVMFKLRVPVVKIKPCESFGLAVLNQNLGLISKT